jgi:putative spermidine/putrescine transport system substrate-binding protein
VHNEARIHSKWTLSRVLSSAALVTAAGLVLGACAGVPSDSSSGNADGDLSGSSMVYASYGGTTEEYTKEAWGDPFQERTGAEAIYASPIDLGKLRAMVESNNVEWDLLQGAYTVAHAPGYENLFEKIDLGDFDTSTLIENTVQDRGVGAYVLSYLIAYRTDAGRSENPVDWADFYNLEKFPGKRGVENYPPIILETALLADGVAPEELYPLDLDRAFKKLDSIKGQIVWYETGAQQQELLQNETVAYLMAWNGRAYDLLNKDVPVGMSFGQQVAYMGYHVIPKGSTQVAAATEFIRESLSPEGQARFAELTAYAPVNDAALDLIDPEVAKYLPTFGDNNASTIWLDEQYWTENLDKVMERWSSWLLE